MTFEVRFTPQDSGAGVCSFASWQNQDLQNALRIAFAESPREKIVRIDVTRDGIKAYFESENVAGGKSL